MPENLAMERLWRNRAVVPKGQVLPDDEPPKSEWTPADIMRALNGDPTWRGNVRISCPDVDGDLVVHSDDLEVLEWRDLPNVFVTDWTEGLSRERFEQYMALAFRRLQQLRGLPQLHLHLMTRRQLADFQAFNALGRGL